MGDNSTGHSAPIQPGAMPPPSLNQNGINAHGADDDTGSTYYSVSDNVTSVTAQVNGNKPPNIPSVNNGSSSNANASNTAASSPPLITNSGLNTPKCNQTTLPNQNVQPAPIQYVHCVPQPAKNQQKGFWGTVKKIVKTIDFWSRLGILATAGVGAYCLITGGTVAAGAAGAGILASAAFPPIAIGVGVALLLTVIAAVGWHIVAGRRK